MMNIFSGAAAGLATNEAQKHIDKHVHQERDTESFFQKLCDLHNDIRTIAEHYRKLDDKPINIVLGVPVSPSTIKLSRYGRSHSYIFVGNATTSFLFKVPGLAPFSYTPALGWTQLDLPHNTEISQTSGSNDITILYHCTNERM